MISRYFFNSFVIIGAFLSASIAYAQPVTFERQIITSSAARQIVDLCAATAAAEFPVPVAIAVVDPFGALIEFHSMQGAGETNGTTAVLKAKTAARWRRSSAAVNQMVTSGANEAPVWIGDFPQPGGVAIMIDGMVVGAVGIGGLPRVPHLHGEPCVIAAIEAVFGPGTTTPPMILEPQ
jgi:glc operon protein GlcG